MAEETPLKPNEIYEKITGGRGSDSLMNSTHIARQLNEQLLDRSGQIKKLSAEIGEGWQGPASEAAAGAALPLAKAAEADGDNLGIAGRAIEQQTTDFGMVRNSVVPVSATKPEMTDQQAIDAVLQGDTGAYDRSVNDWREKGNTNVQAFSRYHEASGANGEQLPERYEPLTDPGYPVSQSSDSGSGSGGTGASGVQHFPGGGGSGTPSSPGSPSPGGGADYGSGGQGPQPTLAPSSSSVHTGTADGPPPASGSESTNTSSYSPNTSLGGRSGSGYSLGSGGLPGDYGGGAHRAQTSVGPYGSGGGYGGGGYGGGGGGFSTGGYGGGSGAGSGGSSGGTSGTGRAPGAANGSAAPGAGRSSGVIPRSPGGAAGARVGTVSGGTGSGSAGTGRGMMPMGGGAGRGQGENEQHERKTPYVENANELFGPDHRGTAPEVIGEVRKKR